jgi:hypothetical protein
VTVEGDCFVWFSFDIAFAMDLDRAAAMVAHSLPASAADHGGISAGSFDFRPPPLVFDLPAQAIDVGPARTAGPVRCILHRFGGVSFVYRVPFASGMEGLVRLSDALYDNGLLRADAERRASDLLATLGGASTRPSLAPMSEDYAAYHVRSISPIVRPGQFVAQHAQRIAQVLRSESRELSEQEVGDALNDQISLTPDDLTIVDWNSAFIIQAEPDERSAAEPPTPADIRAVLELANMSLLELRFLDDRLDRILDGPPDTMSWRARRGRFLMSPVRAEIRRLAELQTDAATLFDAVVNSYKIVGDHYLARLFRLASHRLRLNEWDASIRRRLATAESITGSMTEFQANRRMEVLEWIIILLIAFEIVMAFIR